MMGSSIQRRPRPPGTGAKIPVAPAGSFHAPLGKFPRRGPNISTPPLANASNPRQRHSHPVSAAILIPRSKPAVNRSTWLGINLS